MTENITKHLDMAPFMTYIKLPPRPHPHKNCVAKVNTLIQFLRPQSLIHQATVFIGDCSRLDGCKIVMGSLIRSMCHD